MAPSIQWRDLYEEVIHLCDSLESVPEECECGNAETHLEGACRCCHGHTAGSPASPDQPHCGERIARLRADLTLLCEDFQGVAGLVQKGARIAGPLAARRDLLLVAGDLGRILATLEDLDRAVAGFRRSCAIADMKQVKRQGAALLARCKKFGEDLARRPNDGSKLEPGPEE